MAGGVRLAVKGPHTIPVSSSRYGSRRLGRYWAVLKWLERPALLTIQRLANRVSGIGAPQSVRKSFWDRTLWQPYPWMRPPFFVPVPHQDDHSACQSAEQCVTKRKGTSQKLVTTPDRKSTRLNSSHRCIS